MPSTPMNSGLPQPALQAGLPIGASLLMPPSGDKPLLFGDGSVWLRAGVLAAKSLYPDAARLEHLRAHGFTAATGTAVTGSPTSIATNGAGTYVIASGSATQVFVSTDNGRTWSGVNHNLGVAVNHVIFANGTFMAAGNSSAAIAVSASASGSGTWTAVTVASGLASLTANTVKLCFNGSVFNAAATGNTTESMWSSPTGAAGTWTSRTMPSPSIGSSFGISAAPDGRVLITVGTSTTGFYSTNGTAFSTTTLAVNPLGSVDPPYFNGNFYVFTNTTTYVTTSNMTTFSGQINLAASVPNGVNLIPSTGGWAVFNGRLVMRSQAGFGIVYTADGATWSYQATSVDLTTPFTGDGATMVASVGGGSLPQYASSSIDSSNFVGRALGAFASGSASLSTPQSYYRVK